MAIAALFTKPSTGPILSITDLVLFQSAPRSRHMASIPGVSKTNESNVSLVRDIAITLAPHWTNFLHSALPIPETLHRTVYRKNLSTDYVLDLG